MSIQHLTRDLALRLAVTCKAMGLDDEDEMLLWRYVASLPEGESVPIEVQDILLDQAVYSPTLIKHYVWDATYPERFYKPKRRLLTKLGWKLERSGHANDLNQVVFDGLAAELSIRAHVRDLCFGAWRDELTACLRADGVNWEPPGDTDVEIRLSIFSVDLKARLAI
jgi:hypothetical protein